MTKEIAEIYNPSTTILRIANWYRIDEETVKNAKRGNNWKNEEEEQNYRSAVQSITSLPDLARIIRNLEWSIDKLVEDARDIDSDEDFWSAKAEIEPLEAQKDIVVDRFAELLNMDKNNIKKLRIMARRYDRLYDRSHKK